MNYVSTAETAKRWGISDRRVRYHASHGNIPNAIYQGGQWMIPENAPHPVDGRKKDSTTETTESYHFPNLIHTVYIHKTELLNPDEQALLQAQLEWYKFNHETAYQTCVNLFKNSSYYHVRVGACHTLVYVTGFQAKSDECRFYLDALEKLAKKEDPHKADYKYLLMDAQSTMQTNKRSLRMLSEKFLSSLSNDALGLASLNNMFVHQLRATQKKTVSISDMQIICRLFERQGLDITAMFMHLDMADIATWEDRQEDAEMHIHAMLDINKNYHIILPLVEAMLSNSHILKPILSEEDPSLLQKLSDYAQAFLQNWQNTISYLNDQRPNPNLSNADYNLMVLLNTKLSDNEIAAKLDLPPQAFQTLLQSLYRKTGSASRQDLINYLSRQTWSSR